MRTREILVVVIPTQRDEQESSDCGQSTSESSDMHACVVVSDGMDAPVDRWGNFKVWGALKKNLLRPTTRYLPMNT
eukprot:679341-Rhodomonas_salina.1